MGSRNMETPRTYEVERDEIASAVLRERELNDALTYLERAISQFASREAPSRWQSSHTRPDRTTPSTRGLGAVLHRCAAAFRTERHPPARFTASPSH
jgi:hypothetical protein